MRRAAVLTAILALALAAPAAAQTPPRDAGPAPAAPAGTARINGIVTSADSTRRPLRSAYVVVIGGTTGTLRVTATDANGQFSVAGLPADRYLIGASKPPYLGAVAGARRPARPGTPIVLAAGQTLDDVAVRLPLGAAISGTITDERGQPASAVPVAVQQWRMQNGERTLVTVASVNATTDERGRYRLFGLAPGEYIVGATPAPFGPTARALTDGDVDAALKGSTPAASSDPIAPAPGTLAPPNRYAPTFFPGTTRPSEATPIVLAAGDDRPNVDFRTDLVRTVQIDGVVVTGDGQPANGVGLVLMPATGNSLQRVGFASRITPDGRFTIQGIPPGTYTLTARTAGPPLGNQYATATVDVTNNDVTGLQVVLRPPLSFSGRIVFQGDTTAPALAGRRLTLRSLSNAIQMTAPQLSATDAAGAFTLTNVTPGRYALGSAVFFGATSDSITWAIDSVTADGLEITDLPIEIAGENVPKNLVVTFTDRSQQVAGRLLSSADTAASDFTLVLFPSDKRYWFQGTRRILVARPGNDGHFVFGGSGPTALPAGEYFLAVVTDIDRDEQFDPAFLSALIPAATPVTLAAAEKKAIDVRIR